MSTVARPPLPEAESLDLVEHVPDAILEDGAHPQRVLVAGADLPSAPRVNVHPFFILWHVAVESRHAAGEGIVKTPTMVPLVAPFAPLVALVALNRTQALPDELCVVLHDRSVPALPGPGRHRCWAKR